MTDVDAQTGSADDARGWIEGSALPGDQQVLLRGFVERFSGLTFARDDQARLDALAAAGQVTLPASFRAARSALVGPAGGARVRFDDYERVTPHSDDVEDIWYDLRPGYANPEQRELFRDRAGVYPFGRWWETDESYLAVRLAHDDPSVVEFAAEDLLDNVLDGRPADASVYPVFASYPAMLGHVVAVQLPDGRTVEAG